MIDKMNKEENYKKLILMAFASTNLLSNRF